MCAIGHPGNEIPCFVIDARFGQCKCIAAEAEGTDVHEQYAEDGKPFHAGNLSISLELDGQVVEWRPGTINYGNLRGTRRTLDQLADFASLEEGILSRDGWTLFDNSGSVIWDLDQTWVEARRDEHLQDWYFFGYGRDYKSVLQEYTQFGGAIPLVPRYVLGNWWSRFWCTWNI